MTNASGFWTKSFASALLALPIGFGSVSAAPPAALGPEAAAAQVSNGFVGRVAVAPGHGAVGTPVTVTAEALPANTEVQIVWRTVKGKWKVADAEYHGREYTPVGYEVARLKTDGNGSVKTSFEIPEDFGFLHDIVIQQGDRVLTQTAFYVDMTVKTSAESGPVGSPINVEVKGIGWRQLQNSWLLLYDNAFTGWISSVSTGGSASFTIPATGGVGRHTLEVVHGDFTFPYLNMQQSPEPDRPRFAFPFTVTSGDPVLPRPAEEQVQTAIRGLPQPGELKVSSAFAPVDKPITVGGGGFEPGKSYALNWTTVTGNRVSGGGWEKSSQVVARATADAGGGLNFSLKVPDDLGGVHDFWVEDRGAKKTSPIWIQATARPLSVDKGPAGTPFTIHLKGVGWTETANIFTVVYDNNYLGYACGFNSQGDVEVNLYASGQPGWHFIDLYPAVYKGTENRPINFRLPQLTYAADHPGEDLPHFRFAFQVTAPITQ